VTHPVVGVGERALGSVLDSLHLSGGIGPGMVAAKRVAKKDFVLGKSMALRRQDLERLGGFTAVCDVLAEDYVLGRLITGRLGKRVVMARGVVRNVSIGRRVGAFLDRYARWSVMHRKAVGPFAYACELLLTPTLLALAAFVARPCARAGALLLGACVLRAALDDAAAVALRGHGFSPWALCAVPLKELLVGAAWLHGLFRDTVVWRSNRLVVLPGTRLRPVSVRSADRAHAAGAVARAGEADLLEDAV
jgi:ceramide glucosyltransferase